VEDLKRDARVVWAVIAVAGLAAWTADVGWGAVWDWGDRYSTSDLPGGLEVLMYVLVACVSITYVGLIALLITMLATLRQRYLPQAMAFTIMVASAVGYLVGLVVAIWMTRVAWIHTTAWMAVVVLGWLGIGGGTLGLWLCARADRRRAAARLAEVEAEIARQQGDVGAG